MFEIQKTKINLIEELKDIKNNHKAAANTTA